MLKESAMLEVNHSTSIESANIERKTKEFEAGGGIVEGYVAKELSKEALTNTFGLFNKNYTQDWVGRK